MAWNDSQSSKHEDARQRYLEPCGDLKLPYHRKRYDQEHNIKDHIRDPRTQRRGSNILAFRILYALVPEGLYRDTLEDRV